MKKIEVIIEKTHTGYSAYAVDFPVYTGGKDFKELKLNIIESLNLYFSEDAKEITEQAVVIKLDLQQFFEFYKVINAKVLGERIGMNQSLLSQYVNGRKKPSAAQTNRIIKGIHALGRELAEISFV